MDNSRTCPVCGDKFTGRIDKKFCSDQCRTEYNNRTNKEATNYMRNINGVLRKNRKILLELNPEGKIKIPKKKLIDRGFNFKIFTSIYTTRNGNTYYFCYEQGYLPLEDDFYALVRKDIQ
jgi:predicted nucleic acid-binding Zn ribbon protein